MRFPSAVKGLRPFTICSPSRVGKGARGMGRHGNAPPNGLTAAAETILSHGLRHDSPTVRNGRAALPQERLPSAPLLTGLSPRCIAQARNLRRGRRAVSPRLRAGCTSAPPLCQRSLLVCALSYAARVRKSVGIHHSQTPPLQKGVAAR